VVGADEARFLGGPVSFRQSHAFHPTTVARKTLGSLAPLKEMTGAEFAAAFATETACRDYLRSRRWPNGVTCPRCQNEKVYELPSKPWHWQCQRCGPRGYRFSVLVGTIFENTNVPLTKWFKVMYLVMVTRRDIRAHQIYRMLGFASYRTVRLMCRRIRADLAGEAAG
jgi:transposase-like protein